MITFAHLLIKCGSLSVILLVNMAGYSTAQLTFVSEQCILGAIPVTVQRANKIQFSTRTLFPSEKVIMRCAKYFYATGHISPPKQSGKPTTARTPHNILSVTMSSQLIRGLSSTRNKCAFASVQRVQFGRKTLKPCMIQVVQKLEPRDYEKRKQFASWFINQCELKPNFTEKIIMSNEAHFSYDGLVNKQNCRFWVEHNPRVVQPTTSLHFIRITVWCAVTEQEIIGLYFSMITLDC